jgi:hypothetical protein
MDLCLLAASLAFCLTFHLIQHIDQVFDVVAAFTFGCSITNVLNSSWWMSGG